MHVRVGGVPPEVGTEWLLEAALASAGDPCSVVTMSGTETLHMWGFDMGVCLQVLEVYRINCRWLTGDD